MSRPTDVWDLVPWFSGIPAPDRCERLLVALAVYVDDSGKNDPPVFVLAGLIASAQQWTAFSDRWRDALAEDPSIDYFKMKEAFHRRGCFEGWESEPRDKKLVHLASIVTDHAIGAVSVTLRHDEYFEVFGGSIMKDFDDPTGMIFHLIMIATFNFLTRHQITDKVDFIFDQSSEFTRAVSKGFNHLIQGMQPEIAVRFGRRPIQVDDKEVVPVQAADMLAWHIRRLASDDDAGVPATQSAAAAALARIPYYGMHFGKKMLNEMYERGRAAVRQLGTLPPYEEDVINETFDEIASYANMESMRLAAPFTTTELVSLPAIGMAKYVLVSSCDACHIPHLHRRSGNGCLSVTTAAWPDGNRPLQGE